MLEESPEPTGARLGDDIDDYCTRCRGLSSHAVAAVLDGKIEKVLCRVCLSQHKYRHGKGGKSKEKERQKLLDEVLRNAPFRP